MAAPQGKVLVQGRAVEQGTPSAPTGKVLVQGRAVEQGITSAPTGAMEQKLQPLSDSATSEQVFLFTAINCPIV